MVPLPADSCEWPEVEEVAQAPGSPSQERRNRLLEAIRYGDSLALRTLIRRGAPLLTSCPEIPGRGGNLIDWALYHDKPDMAMRLLKVADSVGLSEEFARGSADAVSTAARKGLSELLGALLARGATWLEATQGPDPSDSPLLMAALRGHVACVRALVAAGAWLTEPSKAEVIECARLGDFSGVLPQGEPLSVHVHNQQRLRAELKEAILAADQAGVEAAVRAGASLMPNYHSSKAAPHYEVHLFDTASSNCSAAKANLAQPELVNPVDWAVLASCPKMALRLLELGDELLDNTSQLTAKGVQPPEEALAHGCRHAVHIAAHRAGPPRWLSLLIGLLSRGADCAQVDPFGRSALHLAVMRGNAKAAQLLVQHGAWKEEAQKSAVFQLAIGRQISAVLELADADLATCATPRGRQPSSAQEWTPPESLLRNLATGIRRGDKAVLRILLGCSSDATRRQENDTVELGAAQWLATASVELPGCGGACGTLIDLAAWHAQEKVALLLLRLTEQHGFGRLLVDRSCHAVVWAMQHDLLELLRLLLSYGADPVGTQEGGSALLRAAEQSREDAAMTLIHAGAWEAEPEKDRVLALFRDRRLRQAELVCSGGGTANVSDRPRTNGTVEDNLLSTPDRAERMRSDGDSRSSSDALNCRTSVGDLLVKKEFASAVQSIAQSATAT